MRQLTIYASPLPLSIMQGGQIVVVLVALHSFRSCHRLVGAWAICARGTSRPESGPPVAWAEKDFGTQDSRGVLEPLSCHVMSWIDEVALRKINTFFLYLINIMIFTFIYLFIYFVYKQYYYFKLD